MSDSNLARTILIADDDPDVRAIVADAIRIMGHTVIEASDGAEAISLFTQCGPDLAVLDVMMPQVSGTEVCSAIKRSESGGLVPVIMLTARDAVKDKVTALEGGADDYITKPFHYQELQARIKALLRIRDLNTALEKQNLELRRTQEKLVQRERQLAVMQLAGTAAHQLGQPLSAIMLNCHLMEVLPHADPKYAGALRSIKDDAKRMADMIERLRSADATKTEEYFPGTAILDLEKK